VAVYGVSGGRRRWQVEVASEGATGRRGAAVSRQLRGNALALSLPEGGDDQQAGRQLGTCEQTRFCQESVPVPVRQRACTGNAPATKTSGGEWSS
jgi:hypothetical protein